MTYQKRTGSLMAGTHPRGGVTGQDAQNDMIITEERLSMSNDTEVVEYVARRLTPKECAKLQGFPADWCDDVPHSDAAEYKLWGNGIALPTILPMMKAMGEEIRNEKINKE